MSNCFKQKLLDVFFFFFNFNSFELARAAKRRVNLTVGVRVRNYYLRKLKQSQTVFDTFHLVSTSINSFHHHSTPFNGSDMVSVQLADLPLLNHLLLTRIIHLWYVTLTFSFSNTSPTSLTDRAPLNDCSFEKSILWCNSCNCSINVCSVTGVSQMCL